MNKNDNLHILFKTLIDTLPYEYDEKLTDNETTIVLTKKDSDTTMYVSSDETNNDDFVVAVSHDDPSKDYYEEYETFYWISEDEQIPLGTIISDIKHYL